MSFQDPGLYPVEVIYYQNGSTAYLEWSRTDSAVAECPGDVCSVALTDQAKYPGQFKLLASTELFSSKIGTNPGCQECGAAGMDCATGNYCGDGLCQSCNLSEHCGTACVKCPASAAFCSGGKCVECTADDQCPTGKRCDIPNGVCALPQPCDLNTRCPPGLLCNRVTKLCGSEDDGYCSLGGLCPTGQTCTDGICYLTPAPCSADADCKAGYVCDLSGHVCRPAVAAAGSGCSAAGVTATGARHDRAVVFGLLLLGAALLVRIRRFRFSAR